jgi:hypothetical protein
MSGSQNNVRVAARKALIQVFEPLANFALEAGMSAGDMTALLRESTVKAVSKRQLETARRTNISGIAATTGIPRAEISRLLKRSHANDNMLVVRHQLSTNRILAAWRKESKFTTKNGRAATLRMYGRGASFESLVKSHGRGIPTRAVLDELVRSQVVEVLPGQKIRARATLAVNPNLDAQVIKEAGVRASGLLSMMLSNNTELESLRFIVTATIPATNSKPLPTLKEELSKRSTRFLSEVREILAGGAGDHALRTVDLTVFCHEAVQKNKQKQAFSSRINFRRRPTRQS